MAFYFVVRFIFQLFSLYQTDVKFVIKIVLGVIDVKRLFIFIVVVGMFYFHSMRLSHGSLRRHNLPEMEKFVKIKVESPSPVGPAL